MSDEQVTLTDCGNSEALARAHGMDLRYLRFARGDSGYWLRWNGCYWQADDSGEVTRRAKATIRSLYELAAACDNDATRAAIVRWASQSESDHRIRAMINLARSEPPIPITTDQLDRDGWKFCCANGVIDLKTGELLPHAREYYQTIASPVEYHPDAECPRWERHLMEVFDGRQALVDFTQRLAGMWLTADTTEHLLVIFHGSGRNGKSVTLEAIMSIMGPYACDAPPDLLTMRRGEVHPTELADLLNRRLVVSSETDQGRYLRVALVKKLTGDQFIKARYMRMDFFEFRRSHKLVLQTNCRPIITERSAAIWSRVCEVPFKVCFQGKEDRALPETLRSEYSGILAWAVRGCLLWQQNGLAIPDEVKRATLEYQAESDNVASFIDEECIKSPGNKVTRAAIWGRYIDWAKRAGERPVGRAALFARLREMGCTDCKVGASSAKGFDGIGIIDHENAGTGHTGHHGSVDTGSRPYSDSYTTNREEVTRPDPSDLWDSGDNGDGIEEKVASWQH